MFAWLNAEWPWYVAGPLIGLFVPALLLLGNKVFGISGNLSHICAAITPVRIAHFRYDWRRAGRWNLLFLLGVVLGGALAAGTGGANGVRLSAAAIKTQQSMGIHDFAGLAPKEIFDWKQLKTTRGISLIIVGGFLVGFGTAYAAGCTSGHAISGLANLDPASLVAVLGFFTGGLLASWFLLPIILGGAHGI